MPTLGAHVSAAGGLYNCFANAEKIGAQCLQIFGASPRQWTVKQPTPEIVSRYKAEERRSGLGPVFLHAAYLANIATHIPPLWEKSVQSLSEHLQIAETLGATGLIFHIGASAHDRQTALARVVKGMKQVLKNVPGTSLLIMENAAGGGGKIGATIEEVGELLHAAKDPRIKVCIDTQHAFAAGVLAVYDKKEVAGLVARCDAAFGWSNVVVLHANDSKTASGSFHDRHENIGQGKIGLAGFRALAANKKTASIPWILEVPGFLDTGPDKKNMDILKKLF